MAAEKNVKWEDVKHEIVWHAYNDIDFFDNLLKNKDNMEGLRRVLAGANFPLDDVGLGRLLESLNSTCVRVSSKDLMLALRQWTQRKKDLPVERASGNTKPGWVVW